MGSAAVQGQLWALARTSGLGSSNRRRECLTAARAPGLQSQWEFDPSNLFSRNRNIRPADEPVRQVPDRELGGGNTWRALNLGARLVRLSPMPWGQRVTHIQDPAGRGGQSHPADAGGLDCLSSGGGSAGLAEQLVTPP
jgi:hypothetical protein